MQHTWRWRRHLGGKGRGGHQLLVARYERLSFNLPQSTLGLALALGQAGGVAGGVRQLQSDTHGQSHRAARMWKRCVRACVCVCVWVGWGRGGGGAPVGPRAAPFARRPPPAFSGPPRAAGAARGERPAAAARTTLGGWCLWSLVAAARSGGESAAGRSRAHRGSRSRGGGGWPHLQNLLQHPRLLLGLDERLLLRERGQRLAERGLLRCMPVGGSHRPGRCKLCGGRLGVLGQST